MVAMEPAALVDPRGWQGTVLFYIQSYSSRKSAGTSLWPILPFLICPGSPSPEQGMSAKERESARGMSAALCEGVISQAEVHVMKSTSHHRKSRVL